MHKRRMRIGSTLLAVLFILGTMTPISKAENTQSGRKVCPNMTPELTRQWDSVYFGNYWQNDTNGDGLANQKDKKEPIRWRVLARDGKYAYLLSDRILDAGKFYAGAEGSTWETSDLRNWLNSTFYDAAFNNKEKAVIQVQTLANGKIEIAGESITYPTKDKVFVPSYQDMHITEYQLSYGQDYGDYTKTLSRMASNTAYTAQKPGMYASTTCSDNWWLRDTTYEEQYAAYVTSTGAIEVSNSIPVNVTQGIRPAIYVDLSDTSLWKDGGVIKSADIQKEENVNDAEGRDGNLLLTAEQNPFGVVKRPDAELPEVPVQSDNTVGNMSYDSMYTQTSDAFHVNSSGHTYSVYGTTEKSYLEQNADGTWTRIEASGDKVYIEYYDAAYQLQSSNSVNMALPIFGGYFKGEQYRFLVTGQNNPKENDNVEVVRIEKYDADWNYIGKCSLKGINTTKPFEAGNLQMTEYKGKIYIHTCHEMYKSSDNINHQANMSFVIDEKTMTAEKQRYGISELDSGYVSHSFNQYITTDGANVYCLDQGDGYPRAVVMAKSSVSNYATTSTTGKNSAKLLEMQGVDGANATGVSIGGLALMGKSLVAVGNSVSQNSEVFFDATSQRNIFVAVTDKQLQSTITKWLTQYSSTTNAVRIGTPYVIVNGDGCYVMWEETNTQSGQTVTKIVRMGADGDIEDSIHTLYVNLSGCKPVVSSQNELVWYMAAGGSITFYHLQLDKLADYNNVTAPAKKPDVDTTIQEPVKEPETPETATTESRNTNVTNHTSIRVQTTPTKVKGLKAKAKGSGKLRITWKKATNAKKYRIQVSLKKNFAKAKTKYCSTTSFVWKGLKKKKQYYVRVQAVSADGVCGAWSKVKKVKVR